LALGPVFAFAVRDAGFQAGNLKITRLNAPGYMIFVANVLFSLLFLLGFSDPKPQSTPLPEEEKNTKTAVELTSKHQESEIIVYSSRHMLKIVLWENGGWLHLVIKFIAGFQQYAMETAITPITRTQFNWGSFENAIALLLIAIVMVIGIVLTLLLQKQGFSERFVLTLGVCSMGIGVLILLVFCSGSLIFVWQLSFGAFFFVTSFPIMNVSSSTLFSKSIDPFAPGFFFGMYSFSFGISGIIPPIIAGSMIDSFPNYLPLFLFLFFVFLAALGSLCSQWKLLGKIQMKNQVKALT